MTDAEPCGTREQDFTTLLYADGKYEKPMPCPYCNNLPRLCFGFVDIRLVCQRLHPHRLGPARKTIRGAVSAWNRRALKISNKRGKQ